MSKFKRNFLNEFGAPIAMSVRTLPIKSHIHVGGPLWKDDGYGNYPSGDARHPVHPGVMIGMQDRYGNLHTNHITKMEAETLHALLSLVLGPASNSSAHQEGRERCP